MLNSSVSTILAFTSSIYIMLMISLERYTAIRGPSQVDRTKPTRCDTAGSLAILVTLSAMFNVPKIWEMEACWTAHPMDCLNSTETIDLEIRLQHSKLYKDGSYNYYYTIGANNLVHWLIPLISLVYLNVGIYRGVSFC